MRENADENKSEQGHFSRSEFYLQSSLNRWYCYRLFQQTNSDPRKNEKPLESFILKRFLSVPFTIESSTIATVPGGQ